MKRLFRWLLGGRPMVPIAYAFTDKVSGLPVWIFRDRYGRHWMATSHRAWFRVRCHFPEAYINGGAA